MWVPLKKWYNVWFLRYWVFCTFNNPKNQHFEKMKKTPRDIILHKFTINDNHIIYDSWDISQNRQIFLSSWAIFCPFTPLTAQRMKILKKWKKHLEISFYTSVPKIMIIDYTVPEIRSVTDVIIFHFGQFFALLPPKQPKKPKFQKNEEKKHPKVSSFNTSYQKSHMLYSSWEMARDVCNFSFWVIFCHFTHLTAWKIKI